MSVSSMLSGYHADNVLDAAVDYSLTSVMVTNAERDTHRLRERRPERSPGGGPDVAMQQQARH